jgi:hypothetical protein
MPQTAVAVSLDYTSKAASFGPADDINRFHITEDVTHSQDSAHLLGCGSVEPKLANVLLRFTIGLGS